MSQWELEFAEAVAALEAAYKADQRAYDDLRDPLKASWALLPTWMWPEPDRVGQMLKARNALIAAEDAVREMVRRQSIAVRNTRARRQTMYQQRAFAQTSTGEVSAAGELSVSVRQPTDARTPTSRNA
ncbi:MULTISPECIES: hypothetical protein [unclassified Variovorax]|uniref:hypothetical protein n=1 Tax=unclassified Variovorax TaxID=663243 RepID=UPI00257512CD|nr:MULTISPECIES: hypothetical protein [unclassified Variovorax]MDM0086467.1 hypothetical protein [Variovorax sp. J22G40]MDM0145276.1 hypothetical protein [Variovorax sp. J2P1-31]